MHGTFTSFSSLLLICALERAVFVRLATPPNALVYATEQVSQGSMMRCGLVLNLVCTAVIAALAE